MVGEIAFRIERYYGDSFWNHWFPANIKNLREHRHKVGESLGRCVSDIRTYHDEIIMDLLQKNYDD
jgi:hypothetical protein